MFAGKVFYLLDRNTLFDLVHELLCHEMLPFEIDCLLTVLKPLF
jgi:hypothetical protein